MPSRPKRRAASPAPQPKIEGRVTGLVLKAELTEMTKDGRVLKRQFTNEIPLFEAEFFPELRAHLRKLGLPCPEPTEG